MAVLAARALWKRQARRLAQAVLPETLVLLAPLLLPVACSVKAEVAVAEVLAALVVLEVQAAVALVAVVARVAAAHTQQALAVSAVLAGHWYWSFDHAAICSC